MKEPIVEKPVSPACNIKELKEFCDMSDKRFKFECNSLRNADQLRDVGVKDGDTIKAFELAALAGTVQVHVGVSAT